MYVYFLYHWLALPNFGNVEEVSGLETNFLAH